MHRKPVGKIWLFSCIQKHPTCFLSLGGALVHWSAIFDSAVPPPSGSAEEVGASLYALGLGDVSGVAHAGGIDL